MKQHSNRKDFASDDREDPKADSPSLCGSESLSSKLSKKTMFFRQQGHASLGW